MSDGNARIKYLGFVAHEIKNPLATALWGIELLKRMEGEARSGPRLEKIVDASTRSLNRMRRLVEDYFTIERLRLGSFDLRAETLQLRTLVATAVAQLAEKDGIPAERFSVDVPEQLPVRGNAELLRRALRGALETLARSAAEVRIAISGHGGEGRAVLVLRGEGLPRPLVPPTPEDRATGDQSGGVLGFLLCESVWAAHGGSIEENEEGLLLRLPEA